MMNQEFYDKLAGIVSKEAILENEPMSKHTTFRIGGNADLFVSPKVNQMKRKEILQFDRQTL